jgi:hypothetical protein
VELFGRDEPVIFAFHGYAGAVHQLLHGRPSAHRFHVRGYREEGTTTTPFDMVVLNRISRHHLAIEAIQRSRRPVAQGESLVNECRAILSGIASYIREHLDDMPEIRNWKMVGTRMTAPPSSIWPHTWQRPPEPPLSRYRRILRRCLVIELTLGTPTKLGIMGFT